MTTIRLLMIAALGVIILGTTACTPETGNPDLGTTIVTGTSVRPTLTVPTTTKVTTTRPTTTTTSPTPTTTTTTPSVSTVTVFSTPPTTTTTAPPPPPVAAPAPQSTFIRSRPITGAATTCPDSNAVLQIYNGGKVERNGTVAVSSQSEDGGFVIVFSGALPPPSAYTMSVHVETADNQYDFLSEFSASWIGDNPGQSRQVNIDPTSIGQEARYITYAAICGWP